MIEDAATLSELYGELDYPCTVEAMRIRLSHVIQDSAHHVIVATNEQGDVVGCVHLGILKSLDDNLSGQILGLIVTQSVRGSGVGRMLMAAAERWAKEHGCCKVILRSGQKRSGAHAFYERIGYINTKTQYVFKKIL